MDGIESGRKSMNARWTVAFALAACVTACGPSTQAPQQPAQPKQDTATQAAPAPPAADKKLTIGVMPKLTGISYFNATEKGAKEAGQELDVNVDFNGPPTADVTLQAQMIETWIANGYDAIAVAPNDPDAIAPALEKARKRGIKVLSWDADSAPNSRDFFVNQCTNESVATSLMDVMAEGVSPDAKYVIITGSLTAANQNIWMAEMEKYRVAKYPGMVNLSEAPKTSGEDMALATQVAIDTMKAHPEMQGLFAITSVALPGAAEALRKTNSASKVFLTGLTTPNSMKEYIKDGTVKKFVLWNAVDLGYLTVHAAVASVKGELKSGATTFKSGRLGECKLAGDQIILGDPIVFDSSNIDKYDF
jgi:rhamnose transport system substrate-binding protein